MMVLEDVSVVGKAKASESPTNLDVVFQKNQKNWKKRERVSEKKGGTPSQFV